MVLELQEDTPIPQRSRSTGGPCSPSGAPDEEQEGHTPIQGGPHKNIGEPHALHQETPDCPMELQKDTFFSQEYHKSINLFVELT